MEKHRWSIPVPAEVTEGAPVALVARRRVEAQLFGERLRIIVDGRFTPHREVEGRFVFGIGGIGCALVPTEGGAFELYVGGRLVEGSVSLAPSSLGQNPKPLEEPETRSIPIAPKWIVAACLALVFLLVWKSRGVVWGREPSWEPSWHAADSAAGRYGVQMPGEVSEHVETENTKGTMLELHTATSEVPGLAAFGVGWADLPASDSMTEKQLELICVGALSGVLRDAKNASSSIAHVTMTERALSIESGHVTCKLAGAIHRPWGLSDIWSSKSTSLYVQDVSFSARGEVVDGRLYLTVAVVSPKYASHPDIARFFGSLRIDRAS